ncbi:MAG: methylated-DNA--[protein]-cysteine S-methyltransferase, partial [Calditrichaeota bacterium]
MNTLSVIAFQWELSDIWLAASSRHMVAVSFARAESFQEFWARLPKVEIKQEGNELLHHFVDSLHAYFSGKLTTFDYPVDLSQGTEFQQLVWQTVQRIPYGTTQTYGQISAAIGKPSAARAVGAANGANPLPILIPCHRVVQSNGDLGGYSGGLDIKDALLR